MLRKIGLIGSLVALALMAALPAYAAGPNFQAGLWADDAQWGTKVTTGLPDAKKNDHSFDAFYFITPEGWTASDGPGGWLQLPRSGLPRQRRCRDRGGQAGHRCGERGRTASRSGQPMTVPAAGTGPPFGADRHPQLRGTTR